MKNSLKLSQIKNIEPTVNKDQIVSKIFILFVAVMPLIAGFGSVIQAPNEWKMWWGIAGVTIFSLSIVLFKYKNQKDYCYSRLLFPILAFVVWSLISLFWVVDIDSAIRTVVQFISYFLTFAIGLFVFSNKKNIILFAQAISVSLFLVVLIGLAQHYFSDSNLINNLYFQTGNMGSAFGNRNAAVQFVVITIPFVFYLFLVEKEILKIYLYSFFIFCIYLFLIVSTARQGYVAILVETILLGFFLIIDYFRNKNLSVYRSIPRSKFKLLIIFMIGIFLVVAANFPKNSSQNKLKSFTSISESSSDSRIPVWINTLEIIKDYPIAGVGASQWSEYYRLYYNKVTLDKHSGEKVRFNSAHNDYLETFANYGLVGFFILLWLVLTVSRMSSSLLINPFQKDRVLILSVVLGLLGFGVVAMVSFPINRYIPGFFVMIYLSIIASCFKERMASLKLNLATIVFTVFATLFSFYYIYIGYQSEYYYRLSVLNFNNSLKDEAITDIEKSLGFKKTARSYTEAGLYLLDANKPQKAIKYLLEAKDRSLFTVSALLNLAEAYRVTGLYGNEQSILKLILDGDNKNVVAAARLVRSLVSMNKYNEADPYYKQLKRNFEYFKNVKAYGPYHSEVSKTALLVEDYKYFAYIYDDLLVSDKTAENYAVYGIVEYQRVGNKSKAKELFVKALEINENVNIPKIIKNDLDL